VSPARGFRACRPRKPVWGLGYFRADDGGAKATSVLPGCWFVRKYGQRLHPDLYRHFNPMPYNLACVMEPELARHLREQGYGVWQN
jgi:hypothetical protein